ncbi:MAG: TolC family protein [Betaproteobacteria bacterium]|nr:TolC family protein [Betaproteobacteria bacterium]
MNTSARWLAAALTLSFANASFAQQATPEPTTELSLRQAVAEAVLRNPNRVRAAHEVRAATFDREAAEWGRFPTLTVDAGAAQSSQSIAPTSTVRVEQPLWAGGRIDGQIDSARAQVSAAKSAEGDSQRRLAEETAVAYVGWMDAQARVDIARESAAALAALLEYVRRRQFEGLASIADVSIGKARYSSALALVEQLNGERDQARAQLEVLIVTRIERGLAVSVPPFADRPAAELEAAYVANSQLVAQRRSEVDAARAQAAVRKAAILPRVALRYEHLTYQNNGLTPPSDSRVMIVLQYSPDAGLASLSGYEAAQSRVDSATSQLAADENDARLRARANWSENRASRRQVDELEPQVASLNDSMASFRRQFEAGRKSWLELLNTQREVVDARISLSKAKTSRDQSALRLMANTGEFWPWLEKLPR